MKNSMIKDSTVFDESFHPTTIVGRSEKIKEITSYLKPFAEGRITKNLYIYGPTGTGKTTIIKSVLKKFDKKSVYVNCWTNRTSHKIMQEILKQIGYMIHGRESTTDLVNKFECSSKKNIIICLDEVDQLKNFDIFYVFARNPCCLVLISNHTINSSRFDSRIESRMHFHEIKFEPYEYDHILSILQDRTSSGLHTNVLKDLLLEDISSLCNGDARAGIQILRNAVVEAESNGLNIVTSQEIETASRNVRRFRLSYVLNKLNDHQRILYNILKANKTLDSGKLFEEYRKQAEEIVTDRSYRNYMQKMVEFELVKESSSGRWKKYEII